MPSFLKSRRFKYGSNSLTAVLLALGILVVINVLSNRYHRRIDTTEGAFHSLSNQTVTLLDSLQKDVNVVAFKAPKQDAETINARMRDPIGPNTLLPNITATVLEWLMVLRGKTKKYATLASR